MNFLPSQRFHSLGLKIKLTLLQVKFWVGIALVLRIFYLIEQSTFSPLYDQLSLDELEVAQTAKAILSGDVEKIPLYKAPLYSWYLAFVMKISGEAWFLLARLGQHLAGVFLIWMVADGLRSLLKNSPEKIRSGCIAGAVAFLAVYAPLIRLENRIVLDFWTVFFQTGLLWALFRWIENETRPTKWLVFAGLFSAFAWLTRPTLTLVLPFILVWIFLKAGNQKRWVSVAVFVLPVLLSVAGLGIRNHQVSGEMLLLPWQGGYDLWMSNRPEANGRYLVQPSYIVSDTANPTFELSQSEFSAAVDRGEVAPPEEGHFYKSLNKYWVSRTKEYVIENPVDWLGFYLKKNLYLLSQEEIYSFESYEVQKEISAVLKRLPPLGFGFVFPLALTGWIWWKKREKNAESQFLLLWIYAVTLTAATALYYASGRMRMPLVVPALMLGVESLAMFIENGRHPKARVKRISIFSGLVLLGMLLSWGDWWGVRSEEFRDREYLRLSSASYKKGQAEQALQYAELAEELNPEYPTIPLLKGQALYALGMHEEAAVSFEESIRRLPQALEAPYNLGVIYWYYLDEGEKALQSFKFVLSRNPGHGRAAALASIAEGIYGSLEESDRLLERARKTMNSPRNALLQVAEIANLQRHQKIQEVKVRLNQLLEQFPAEATRKMLVDDLKRARVL